MTTPRGKPNAMLHDIAVAARAVARSAKRGAWLVAALVAGLRPAPAYACEPVKLPLRQAEQVVFLATTSVQANGDVRTTVLASQFTFGDVPAGQVVLVPWAFGPDCKPVQWNANKPWSPPAAPAVYAGKLRARDLWIGERPIVDIYMANLQPLWADGSGARGDFPGTTDFLTAAEFLEFYAHLPTDRDFDSRQPGSLDHIDRWESDHRPLADREPARSMLVSLRWLWAHGAARATSLPAEAQSVDRRTFELIERAGSPDTYSVYAQFADDLPGGASRRSQIAVYRLGASLYLRITPESHAKVAKGAFAYAFQLSRDAAGTIAVPAANQPGHGPSGDVVRAMDFRNSDNTGPNAIGPKNVNAPGEFRQVSYAGHVMEIRVLSFEIVGLGPSPVPAFARFSCLITIRPEK
jgi:hypothetical protein